MIRRSLALALVAALLVVVPSPGQAEPGYVKVSATQVVTNTTLAAGTTDVIIFNDGANEVYYRLFTSGETAANATTSSAELKSGEKIRYTFKAGSTLEVSGAYYKTLSLICAAGETATVRVYSK